VSAAEVGLAGLLERLEALHAGALTEAALAAWVAPALHADPLGAERSDAAPWDRAPDEARLFWRLVYLFVDAPAYAGGADDEAARDERRALAGRVAACARSTESAALTHELLPVLADQGRLCGIVDKHARGIISRTGFLSVLAESGYPPHVKLWLEHAPHEALARLCALLEAGDYRGAAAAVERAP
jgi:hypothetical protein